MKHTKQNKLGTLPILPLLTSLSIPAIASMTVQALYNVVDSIWVARISTDALAALSLAFPIQMILIAIAVGTGVGTNSLISRLLGRGDATRASNVAEHVIFIAIIYGILVGTVGLFFAEDLIRLFQDDPELVSLSTSYIRIIMMGSIFLFIPMMFNNILRGQGNTLIPMISMIIGAGINIILDPLIIFGIGFFPKLGIEGAAYATVISRLISGIYITTVLFSKKNELTLKLKSFNVDISILKQIYQVGFPAMVMQFLASVMIAGINKIVPLFTNHDETAIAVTGVYFRLQSFVFMPLFGLNQGLMPILGYNYGHNNPERMKKAIKYASFVVVTIMIIAFTLFQVYPRGLISLFNDDKELLRLGVPALKRISIAFPFIGGSILASSIFQAIGKGLPSLTISFVRQILMILPIMFGLGAIFGFDALWYAFPISEAISFFIIIIWLTFVLRSVFKRMKFSTEK